MITRLAKGATELQAVEWGRLDAMIDPESGKAAPLPGPLDALRADHARARSLLRLSSDWQWEKDKDYRFVSCEGVAVGGSAFEDRKIIGKRLWDLPFDNMSKADWRAHRSELARHAGYRDLELRCCDHTGAVRHFSLSGEPVFDPQGQFRGYRGIARDISNLRHASGDLQASSGIAQATLDALAAQICVLDSAGSVILANRAWRGSAATRECLGVGIPVGENYLAGCDRAGDIERMNGIAIATGIRQVIGGERDIFRHEYCRDSPRGRFWFVLSATAFSETGATRAVISHEKTNRPQRAAKLPETAYPDARRAPIANSVLAAMPRKEYQRLLPGLEPVALTLGDVLHEPGDSIQWVYFPSDCLISLLTQVEDHMALEVGLVGNEGMVGISLALGIGTSSVRALVQATGTAMRMDAARFQHEFKQSPALQGTLYRYANLLMAQFSQTAACNRFHIVEARLARWLLMTRDRLQSDHFHLTHESLAALLGVQRVGITNAASALRRRKLIEYSRGDITILDREGLKTASCTCYQVVKQLFDGP